MNLFCISAEDDFCIEGAVAGKREIVTAVRSMHNVLGGTVDPHAAFLLLRGMKTLGIRVNQQNRTAMEIASRLESHPCIQRVRPLMASMCTCCTMTDKGSSFTKTFGCSRQSLP